MMAKQTCLVLLALVSLAAPASAQWNRVLEVPEDPVHSVWTRGDTIAAGLANRVAVSFDAGVTWSTSTPIAPGVTAVNAARVHQGRLYAGTDGHGVFVSSDRGATWQSFNQGLVGGFANAQLFIVDLLLRTDTLYAATLGAGPWIRNLASGAGWSRYGDIFEPDQATNMQALAVSETRLFACAGGNGDVYFRDPGQPDWTQSLLRNDRIAPGVTSLSAIWTGNSWLVASNIGVFRSALGESPWAFSDVGLSPIFTASLAVHHGVVFLHLTAGGTMILFSTDDGASWQVLDVLPLALTFNVATLGNTLYAARLDGLWRRAIDTVAVPPGPAPRDLRFAIAGSNPIRDEARFRFELPEPGRVRIDLFDISGRRAAGGVDEVLPAGAHERQLQARNLAPGMYLARLSAGNRSAVLRLVRTR